VRMTNAFQEMLLSLALSPRCAAGRGDSRAVVRADYWSGRGSISLLMKSRKLRRDDSE
jgi:hypothetical protein